MGIIVIRLNDHQNGNACLDIIDGQQRIMSLAMLGLQNGMGKTIPLLNREMSAPNNTPAAQNYLLHARDAINAWGKTLDFDYLECGVVKLSKDTPPDLAYAFFNHVNASGKRLSDYDLLKSHHLRFVEGDVMSERMANAWDADFGAEGTRATVLHKMLYRLRKWTAGEYFRYAADEVPSHDLFRHFECRHPPILGLVKAGRDDHFDSTVHGGIPFFTFCQRYFDLYREFCGKEVVQDLKNRLANHSNNVLCDAIESMAFLFYAKFGGLHLPEAVYCLAFHLSRLRNEKQIRCAMLSSSPLFRETALLIAHAGDENDVIAALLDESEYYEPTNAGMRAGWYWNDLALFLKSLNKHMVFLPESEEEKAHHPFNRAYRFEAALQKKNQGV